LFGGGGLWVSGGGGNSSVILTNCSLLSNRVVVVDTTRSGKAAPCGGGAAVYLGGAVGEAPLATLSNLSVSVTNVDASGNIISCETGCQNGEHMKNYMYLPWGGLYTTFQPSVLFVLETCSATSRSRGRWWAVAVSLWCWCRGSYLSD
jgi:hypothetical protein